MAMLGINSVSQYQGRAGTLERIARGVQIATNLLGTGTQIYKTFAADIPQAKAQTEYLQSHTQMEKQNMAVQLAQMGFMPVDTDHIHVPDVSTGPGAVQMQQGGKTVSTNQATPNVMKIGNQTFLQVANTPNLNDIQKKRLDGELENGNWVLTGESDQNPKKVPFLLPGPGQPFSYWKKPAELPQEKNISLSQQAQKDFEGLDDVARYNSVHQSAQYALNYADDIKQGQAPDPSRDAGLAQSFVNALSKTNRGPNAGNIEDTQKLVEAAVPGAWQQIKGAITGGTAKIDDHTRNNLMGAIGLAYQSMRPLYDSAYQSYSGLAQSNGLSASPAKPLLNFSGLGMPQGGLNGQIGGAKSPGMQQERMRANQPGFQTQFPNPTPAQNPFGAAKSLLGIDQ